MAQTKKLTPSEIDGVQYRRSKTWQIALAMLTNGSNMAFYTLVGLMSYLGNQGYGVLVAVVGVVLTGTRIFDGLIDPFLAIMIDKLDTKFGKLRILLLSGWLIRTIAVLFLFIWGSSGNHGIVYFVIMYLLYIFGSSICDITGNMIPAVMTNDPKQRPMINVYGTIYSYLFPMIFSLVSTMIILPKYNNQYTVPMLASVCILNVSASLVLLLIACIGLTPIDKPESFRGIAAVGEEDSVKFRDMLHFIKGNRPFTLYLISAVSEKLAQQTGSQAVVVTMLFGILIGNIQFGSLISIISMLPAILFAIIGAKFAGKFGNKESMIIWMRVCLGIAILSVIFCSLVDMRSIPSNIVLLVAFFALLLILNGAKMCVTTANGAMRADIIDYELDRAGKYMPAVVTATYNFVDQLVTSIGSTIALGCVALIGYTQVVPQPTDAPTPAILWMTMFLYYGMPIIGWIAGLIAMHFYKLSKQEMVEVQKRIQTKKEALIKGEAQA